MKLQEMNSNIKMTNKKFHFLRKINEHQPSGEIYFIIVITLL